MSARLMRVVAVFALFAIAAATTNPISASPPAQSPPDTDSGTELDVDSFDFLVAVLADAYENETLTDDLSERLADLFIENLVTPATGETPGEVESRLSGQDPFDVLNTVLTEARDAGTLTDVLSGMLADLFIENLIAPVTGETPEETELRLSSRLEPDSVVMDLPAGWSGSLAHSGGARIEVPADAIQAAATVGIEEVEVPDYLRRELAGGVYDFTVGDHQVLDEPVTLHIPYELEEGQDPANLVAVHWNEEKREWEQIGGVVDEATGTVRVTTSELSNHAVGISASGGCQVEEGVPKVVEEDGDEKTKIVRGGDGEIVVGEAFRATAVVRNDAASDLDDVYVVFHLRHADSGDSIETYRAGNKTIGGNGTQTFESEWFAAYQPLKYTVICEAKKHIPLWPDDSLDQVDYTFTAGEYWRPSTGGSDNISARLNSCEVLQEGNSLRARAKGNFPDNQSGQEARFNPIVTFRILSDDGRTDMRFSHTATDFDDQGGEFLKSNSFTLSSGGYTLVCSLFRGSNVHTGVFRNATDLNSLIRIGVSLLVNPVSTIQELVLKLMIFNEVAKGVENRGSTATFFTIDASGNVQTSSMDETGPDSGSTGTDETGSETGTTDMEIPEPDRGGTDDSGEIRGRIEVASGHVEVEPDEVTKVKVVVTNTGDRDWNYWVVLRSYYVKRVRYSTRRIYEPISSQYQSIRAGQSVELENDNEFYSDVKGPHGLELTVFRDFDRDYRVGVEVLDWKEHNRFFTVAEKPDETDLSLSLRAPAQVDAGETLTYTIGVTNRGPDKLAKGVQVTSSLNQGAVFASASSSHGVRCSGETTITCDFKVVEEGKPEEVEVTVNVPRSAGGQLVNSSSVSMTTDENIVDDNPHNDDVSVTTSVSPVPQSPDRPALVALYESADGRGWRHDVNWLTDEPISEWYGVQTDPDGRVTGLSLPDNGLDETIPFNLGTLSELTYLDLSSNRLTGQIPPGLGSLSNLETLSLGANQLTGAIPPELADIESLQAIILRENQFTGCIPGGLRDVESNDFHLLGLPFCDSGRPSEEDTTPVVSPPSGAVKASFQDFFVIEHELDEFGDHDRECRTQLGGGYRLADWNDLQSYRASGGSVDQLISGLNWIREQDWDTTEGGVRGPRVSRDGAERLGGTRRHYFVSRHDHEVPSYYLAHDGIDNHHLSLGSWYGEGGEALCYRTGELVIPPTPESFDRTILVTLYNSTDGPNWTDNTNWLSDLPVGEWHGVTTDQSGRVTHIYLGDNRLGGSIPAELGDLSALNTLYLDDNRLSGSIPPELGDLSNLTDLRLNGNQLSGRISSELRRLSNLTVLELGDNRLSGPIPYELGNLTNLTGLYLYDNQLSGTIPSELGSLSNLEDLQLGDNQLSGEIPPELGNLSDLTKILLSGNQFTGCIPEGLRDVPENDLTALGLPFCGASQTNAADREVLVALYNSTDGPNWATSTNWLSERPLGEWYGVTTDEDGRVTRLVLNENRLSGPIPSELGNLTNLTELWLPDNQLSGSIPTTLGDLAKLEVLELDRNPLSGSIPSELGNLSNLEVLVLYENQLSGPIPSELGRLSNLTGLSLAQNQLSGSIPSELGNLSNLRWMVLQVNQLSGSIPSSLGRLSNLTRLALGENQLSGQIPSSLGNLTSLEHMYLADNQLSGPIPSSLGNLTNLTELWLYDNQLSGSIPTTLGDLAKLEVLELDRNPLSGSIPSELGRLSNLTWLGLYDNQLSGSIPSSLGSMDSLKQLVLSRNQLSGSIPSELGRLSNLRTLDLGRNQLSGSIPSSLGNLTNLTGLALHENQLSGPIPSSLGNLTNLTELWLYDNQLSGSIPTTLGDLAKLELLVLHGNQLSGSIPSSLGNLTNLEILGLDKNQLSGSIPTTLGDLAKLELLVLFTNQLSGPIPSELGRLSNLTRLDLGQNQLTGSIPSSLGNLANLKDLFLGNNQLSGTLPNSLTRIGGLEDFYFHNNAGLCAPADAVFQTWLNAIPDWAGDICGEMPTSTSTTTSGASGEPPIAEAGPDQYAQPGDHPITLKAAGSREEASQPRPAKYSRITAIASYRASGRSK